MSLEFVEQRGITYAIDWELVSGIVYSYCQEDTIISNIKKDRGGRITGNIEIDWAGQRNARDAKILPTMTGARTALAQNGVDGLIAYLDRLISYTVIAREDYARITTRVSRRFMLNLQAMNARRQPVIDIVRFVRDLSADTLFVGAVLLSGGAALGVAGTGAAIKGFGTYTETKSLSRASVEATTSFALTAIPIARGMGGRIGQATRDFGPELLILLQFTFDLSKSMMAIQPDKEGNLPVNQVRGAIVQSGVNAVSSVAFDRFLQIAPVKAMISKVPFPAVMTTAPNTATTRIGAQIHATRMIRNELAEGIVGSQVNAATSASVGSAVNSATDHTANQSVEAQSAPPERRCDIVCAQRNTLDLAIQPVVSG